MKKRKNLQKKTVKVRKVLLFELSLTSSFRCKNGSSKLVRVF